MKKLVDSNVWLALTLSKHVFHTACHEWLKRCTKTGEVLFCRATQQSFLRLLTTRAVLNAYGNPPLSNAEAWAVYEGYGADKRITFAEEPRGLMAHWKKMSATHIASPKIWMDSYLAAFAIAGGYQLVTTDEDFRKYEGLQVHLVQNSARA
jgi:toxin-antitoxin system PIN domain toxin